MNRDNEQVLERSSTSHGNARQRAGVIVGLAAVGLTLTLTVAALWTRSRAPARIVAAGTDASDTVVINSLRSVEIPVRVLDGTGDELNVNGMRYRWESGTPLAITPRGVVTCARRDDATVRASFGRLAADIVVLCRPVREVQASTWVSLVSGGPARHLPFKAIGVDGRPVTELRGELRVLDSSVATLDGASVQPRGVGETLVSLRVGDRSATMRVIVHEPVSSFMGLRRDQRLVAVPVHLARGDTVAWALPDGVFWLKYVPRRAGDAPPTITLHGRMACTPGDGLQVYLLFDEYGIYCVRHPGAASVTLGHGATGAPVVDGYLALERLDQR